MLNLSMNQIQERFARVEQSIDDAERACLTASNPPQDLKECITEMGRRSHEAHDLLQQTQDEGRIVQCVDTLEQLGDRARDACRRAGMIDPELRNAVQNAHDELSSLKHQLH